MAADWIKIENTTPDKPEVWMISEELNISPDEVVGKLVRVWIWADEQTIDGNASGVTHSLLDRIAGVPNFANAMLKTPWLMQTETGLVFSNFDRHNGKGSKKRALTTNRVRQYREKSSNASIVTKALPEKRREEYIYAQSFDAFWSAYPRKVGKAQALKAWLKLKPNQDIIDRILDNLRNRSDWVDQKFIPHASTYLNGARWEDELGVKKTGGVIF